MSDYYRSSFLEHPLCRELDIGSVAMTGSKEKKRRSLERRCAMDFIGTSQTNNENAPDEIKHVPFYKDSRRSPLPVYSPAILAHEDDNHNKRMEMTLAPRHVSSLKIRLQKENHEKYYESIFNDAKAPKMDFCKESSSSTPSSVNPLNPPPFKLRPVSSSIPNTLPSPTNNAADDITVIASNVSRAHFQQGKVTNTSNEKGCYNASTVNVAQPNDATAVLLASIRTLMGQMKTMNPVLPSLEKHFNKKCNDKRTTEAVRESNCFHKGSFFNTASFPPNARPRIVSIDANSDVSNHSTLHSPALCTHKSHLRCTSQLLGMNMNGKESPLYSSPSLHPLSSPLDHRTRERISMTDLIHQRRAQWKKMHLEDHSNLLHTITEESNISDDEQVKIKISPEQSSLSPTQPTTTTKIARSILHKRFNWKHYPELEAFLIENRDEYLRHSALNYSTEQRLYNNRLTGRLIELAKSYGYVFDPETFTFAMIRDRIRCYFKTYIQSCKRRGVIVGYTVREA